MAKPGVPPGALDAGVAGAGEPIIGVCEKEVAMRLVAMKSKLAKGSEVGPEAGLATREASWKLPKAIGPGLVAIGLAIREYDVPNEPKWLSDGLSKRLLLWNELLVKELVLCEGSNPNGDEGGCGSVCGVCAWYCWFMAMGLVIALLVGRGGRGGEKFLFSN